MGSWGVGVFENDDTADFAIEFDSAAPAEREDLLRRVLTEALEADTIDLEDYAGAAIAAAAIVATTLPNGPQLTGSVPESLARGVSVPPDLVPLALRAFGRVIRDEPEYAEM